MQSVTSYINLQGTSLGVFCCLVIQVSTPLYRSGMVNSKSFVGKALLQIKQKFKLTYAL